MNSMHIIMNIFGIINSMTKLHTLVIIENIVLTEIKGISMATMKKTSCSILPYQVPSYAQDVYIFQILVVSKSGATTAFVEKELP
jgi:hypothetical protein